MLSRIIVAFVHRSIGGFRRQIVGCTTGLSGSECVGPCWTHAANVFFSPDGRTLLTRSLVAGAARLWDVKTLRQLGPALPYFHIRSRYLQCTLGFAPDGRHFLAAAESDIRLSPLSTSRHWGATAWSNWLRVRTGQELDAGGLFKVLDAMERRSAQATARGSAGP